MKRRLAIMVALFGFSGVLSGEEKALSLPEARAEFQKHDQALNAVYAGLKKDLEAPVFEVVKRDQREWIDYRDYVSEGQARFEQQDPEESAAYWEMAAGMTESRLDYLKAWRGVGDEGGWTGVYRDGRGGLLEMVETKEGVYFILQVVRGPSFHLGVLGGLARANESLARFSLPIEGTEEECWITFIDDLRGDGRMEVVTANSHEFHGARAYFDNPYLRVGLLDGVARARVIKTANAGGMLEE